MLYSVTSWVICFYVSLCWSSLFVVIRHYICVLFADVSSMFQNSLRYLEIFASTPAPKLIVTTISERLFTPSGCSSGNLRCCHWCPAVPPHDILLHFPQPWCGCSLHFSLHVAACRKTTICLQVNVILKPANALSATVLCVVLCSNVSNENYLRSFSTFIYLFIYALYVTGIYPLSVVKWFRETSLPLHCNISFSFSGIFLVFCMTAYIACLTV